MSALMCTAFEQLGDKRKRIRAIRVAGAHRVARSHSDGAHTLGWRPGTRMATGRAGEGRSRQIERPVPAQYGSRSRRL